MGISKWNKKEDHEEGITLSDVIRGLQFCVNSSAEIMEQHHLATMASITIRLGQALQIL